MGTDTRLRERWDPNPRALAEILLQDRALLDQGEGIARVGIIAERAITLGVGQRGTFPGMAFARAQRIPVLSRPSGGGSLLHLPGDLHFAVILPKDHPAFPRRFTRAYAKLGGGWVRWLASLGREAQWGSAPGSFPEYCLTGALGEVLSTPQGVLGGASQLVTSRGLLHHGVVSRSLDEEALSQLFAMPGPVRSRLKSLSDIGVEPRPSDLARIAEALADLEGEKPGGPAPVETRRPSPSGPGQGSSSPRGGHRREEGRASFRGPVGLERARSRPGEQG